jgi:hypothetical protein
MSGTASMAYADGQIRIRGAISDLQARLRHHAKRQKRARWDWGYPGDLGRVLALLDEAKAGLPEGDRAKHGATP